MKMRDVKRSGSRLLSVVLSVLLCLWLVPAAWADTGPTSQLEDNPDDLSFNTETSDGDSVDDGLIVDEAGNADSGSKNEDEGVVEEKESELESLEAAGSGQKDAVEAETAETEGESPSDESSAGAEDEIPLELSYAAHVGNEGWQGAVKDGSPAGTTGKSLPVEAVRFSLSETASGAVRYQVYAQGKGWLAETADGTVAGTTGQSRPIEALRIQLDGDAFQRYDVYYRVHVSNIGWLGWTSNGKSAGTLGYAYAIEAIEAVLVEKGASAPGPIADSFRAPGKVSYSAHVSNIGWQGRVVDGALAGTTGRSLAVEALRMDVSDLGYEGGIAYSAHVAGIGWQSEVQNGAVAGTVGRSKAIEAVRIRLTGELAQQYDIYYQVHVKNYGWLDWASNGADAGSTGLGFRAESIRVQLVAKGAAAPGSTARPSIALASVTYAGHVQNIGWQSWVGAGAVAGTVGRSLSIEALQMKLSSAIPGGISYRLHVQNEGWQGWVSDGATAGTTGRALRAEALSIKLTGEAAQYYDVYYRVHAQAFGWLGWAKNGANAGTSSCSFRMEALQVVVVGKGGDAPGTTAGAYRTTPPIPVSQSMMNNRANGLSSSTGWLLMVDTANCLVGVYRGSRGHWVNQAFWPCAPGLPSTPTVKGRFTVGMRGYSFGSGYTCYYWTQFYGNYLFHSIKYYQGTRTVKDGTLGRPASAGCVRLEIGNAKWIYDTIPSRTTVMVY